MENLYSDYRGERYTSIRSRWEPWYSPAYNDAHEQNWWLEARASTILNFLPDLDFSELHIIDVGGDTGEIAHRLGSKSFEVREISNRAKNREEVRISNSPKLGICTHVIEHVAEPFEFLRSLVDELGSVYFEVPNGVPRLTAERKSFVRFMSSLLASLSPRQWALLTSPSAGREKPAAILRQSEHLSFFLAGHFDSFCKRAGLSARVGERQIPTPDGKEMGVICVYVSRLTAESL